MWRSISELGQLSGTENKRCIEIVACRKSKRGAIAVFGTLVYYNGSWIEMITGRKADLSIYDGFCFCEDLEKNFDEQMSRGQNG